MTGEISLFCGSDQFYINFFISKNKHPVTLWKKTVVVK